MESFTRSKSVMLVAAFIVFGIQSACTPAVQSLPSQTAVIGSPSPLATDKPAATATSTATPEPSSTPTPAGTPTQLPTLTPPAAGFGNVAGLVLWNGKPVAHGAVWLCTSWPDYYHDCAGYKTNTDKNGYYVFQNVKPGSYVVAMNSFGSSWFMFYFDAKGSKDHVVAADESLVLDPWNIWKVDLHVIYPGDGKAISNASPTFKWEAYPEASYYQISIFDNNETPVIQNEKVNATEYTPASPLVSCHYRWFVEAYNTQGIRIAQNTTGTDPRLGLTIYGVPGSC